MVIAAGPVDDGSGVTAGVGATSARSEPPAWTLRPAPGEPPAYYVSELADGEARVVEGDLARRTIWSGAPGAAVLWNGGVGVSALCCALALPSNVDIGPVLSWALGPFVLVGAWLAFAALWSVVGRLEWRAGPGYLERQTGWGFSPHAGGHRYRRGEFQLWKSYTYPGTWELVFWRRGLAFTVICRIRSERMPAELQELGRLLAERTGWPLEEGERWWM